jgi:Smr domain
MSNLLGIGTKVKFLRTPDAGTITAKLGDGMVMVQLDEVDMEIPAFEEDLVRAEDFLALPKSVQNAANQIVKPKISAATPANTPLSSEAVSAPVFTQSGVILSFVPIKKNRDEIADFDVYLTNDTLTDTLVEFDFVVLDRIKWTKDILLKSKTSEKITVIPFDTINDQPEADISLKPIFTEGVGEETFKTLKIKPKQFVKNLNFCRPLGREAYTFMVLEKWMMTNNSGDDLKNYTAQLVKSQSIRRQRERNDYGLFDPTPNVSEYASFVPELDLHIEMLHENPQTLSNEEIIHLQLRAFEMFLDKAIRLNVMRVHVIHGIGKGVLRDRIAARLRRHEHVMTFKNEYHEKFGFGATEIWLR